VIPWAASIARHHGGAFDADVSIGLVLLMASFLTAFLAAAAFEQWQRRRR
jgi:hypothetical protein